MDGGSPVAAAFGIGVALAAAPGPVQAVVLSESVRGGVGRGLRAVAGVHVTFGALLAMLALGLSVATPRGSVLRGLEVAGGLLLLWLAYDGIKTAPRAGPNPDEGRRVPPAVRGMLAILLNPGGWLFLGAVASPLLATATWHDGTTGALLAAVALVAGAATGDIAVVLLGGLGLRKAGARVDVSVRIALAGLLAGLGVWLLVSGLIP